MIVQNNLAMQLIRPETAAEAAEREREFGAEGSTPTTTDPAVPSALAEAAKKTED